MNDDELQRRLAGALTPAAAEPPADRVATLRARAEQVRAARETTGAGVAATGPSDPTDTTEETGGTAGPVPARRGRLVLALAASVAALVAAGAVGAALTSGPEGSEQDLLARGTDEFGVRLVEDDVTVVLDGSRAPEGRIVVLQSESLPILPLGEYYELWFVGPDDAPDDLDRVSAGTFHPDYDDGTTLVVLHAAVDPTLFGEVEITAETTDGDPAPSADVVLRGRLDLLG